MNGWTPKDPKWLYLADRTLPPPPGFADESRLGKAWQRLQVLHTPFRTIDPEEYRWIVDWLAGLERLFLDRTDLGDYYRECFAPETRATDTEKSSTAKISPQVSHVATIQAQFMEEVFYALALDRHANAPDNRGWMNLFRRWGRSKCFNDQLDTLRSLLTLRFLTFYDYYLRFYPCRIDEDPIPHPWDSEKRRRDPRPPGTIPERTGGLPNLDPDCVDEEPEAERKVRAAAAAARAKLLPGLYLDSGIREGGTRPPPGGPGAAPASPRDEGKADIDRTPRPQQKDSGNEPGGSAPTRPNK